MKAERRDQVSPGSIACDSVAAALCVSHIELIAFQSIKWLFTFDVMSGIYQWVDETIGQQFAGPRTTSGSSAIDTIGSCFRQLLT